jgi:tRNA(fMet)-specific endonuclease VapC
MRYLLDTNIWIAVSKGDESIQRHMLRLKPEQFYVSSVTRGEMVFGAWKSKRIAETMRSVEEVLGRVRSLPFDDEAATLYGLIRAELERIGRPIGGNDLLIASIALANDCVVVTRNEREFRRVPGLIVETWT